ncbi:unnamed protein product [Protopolystoma xenopodis]|uniref:Uncharacterized protein n=1 Tax=Protopolystoma xenopodis TaxID=117903 RepID=A0A3S5C1B3_9PLAT|nr:unnamed protein product [Protopolystoma xenopodis]
MGKAIGILYTWPDRQRINAGSGQSFNWSNFYCITPKKLPDEPLLFSETSKTPSVGSSRAGLIRRNRADFKCTTDWLT